ncbi:MAG: transposase [Methylococcales bacterium]
MKRRKVGMIPAKADVEAQETFQKEELEPRLEEAKAGKRAVFFVDAACPSFWRRTWGGSLVFCPPVHSCARRSAALQCPGRPGRHHPQAGNDHQRHLYQRAQRLRIVAANRRLVPWHAGHPREADNARYQKCRLVTDLATQLNIELLFLLSFSPNLNLIERLWKFVKAKCLYSIYYPNFKEFKQGISGCLVKTTTTHKENLDTLLTLRFQTFEQSQIMTT